jgi:hypothetical protein
MNCEVMLFVFLDIKVEQDFLKPFAAILQKGNGIKVYSLKKNLFYLKLHVISLPKMKPTDLHY